MQAKLRIKQFGPIKEVDLELKNVNVFIGPQASGKSAIAKIYTIFKSPLAFMNKPLAFPFKVEGEKKNADIENFKATLEEYNVLSFLQPNTFIEFDSEVHYLKYENDTIFYERKLLGEIELLEKLWTPEVADKESIANMLFSFKKKLFNFFIFFNSISFKAKIPNSPTENEFRDLFVTSIYTGDEIKSIVDNIRNIEAFLEGNTALYIPAERNFIPIIKGASLSLLNNNVPIPKHILSFGAEYEKASFEVPEVDLSFVMKGLKYINESGIDQIVIDLDTKVKLTQAASGLQSLVPLLLPILAQKKSDKFQHKSFVIEEPELNLFPYTQYELIKSLEEQRVEPLGNMDDVGVIHTYTTHSPFILAAFNNMLFANKVVHQIYNSLQINESPESVNIDKWLRASTEVKKILPRFIFPENFSAYQISNGTAESIVENGLIKENFIDQTSDKLGEDFEALMDLMEQYK